MKALAKALLAALLLLPAPPAALASEPFDGRTITYVVGTKPGGGYDRYARLIAPYLESQLPGATVVVVNEPAGNGLTALRRLMRASGPIERIVTFNTGFFVQQAAGRGDAALDLNALNYVGKASSEARFLIVRANAGLATLAALQQAAEPVTCLSSSPHGASHAQTRALIEAFALNARLISGFQGAEGEAALAKGEADCLLTSESNLPAMLDADLIEIVGRIGTPEAERFAAVPDLAAAAAPGRQAETVAKVAAMTALGRVTAAAPGADPAELAVLRQAYAAALGDPDLLEAARQRGMALDPADGETVQALATRILSDAPVASEPD